MSKPYNELTYNDYNSPRYMRAHRFSQAIESTLAGYLPQNGKVRQMVRETLMEVAWNENLAIIQVPSELDALNELQLRQQMVTNHPLVVNQNG